jgi:hypothetical protein
LATGSREVCSDFSMMAGSSMALNMIGDVLERVLIYFLLKCGYTMLQDNFCGL